MGEHLVLVDGRVVEMNEGEGNRVKELVNFVMDRRRETKETSLNIVLGVDCELMSR